MTAGRVSRNADARADLLARAEALRPELHRYCARLTGSVIDGEDIVQDTLIRAMASLGELASTPQLRPWLFRIAHNRAIDLLRSRAGRRTEPLEIAAEAADEAAVDPLEALMRREAVATAVSRFLELPVLQRSVIVLKDVLDEPLADIATLLDLSVDAVKAHLARGRARLHRINAAQDPGLPAPPASPALVRYTTLFNDRNWSALRALLADDVKLVQSSRSPRVGAAQVGAFFGFYADIEGLRLVPVWIEGREMAAVFEGEGLRPAYAMRLEWRDGRIGFIRDYRYDRYVFADADYAVLAPQIHDPGR